MAASTHHTSLAMAFVFTPKTLKFSVSQYVQSGKSSVQTRARGFKTLRAPLEYLLYFRNTRKFEWNNSNRRRCSLFIIPDLVLILRKALFLSIQLDRIVFGKNQGQKAVFAISGKAPSIMQITLELTAASSLDSETA